MGAKPVLLAVATVAAMCICAGQSRAQVGTVSAVGVRADHDLLGATLFGGAAHVSIPIGSGGASIRLGAERVSGHARRIGSTCSGLVQPGTCGHEPLRDEARLSTAAVGLEYGALAGRQFAFDVLAGIRFGQVRVDTRGLTSGGTLSTSKGLRGVELGVDGSWFPVLHVPAALEVGFVIGELEPAIREQIIDGYTPFEEPFTVARLRVGLSWRPNLR